jgi:hypothetical protein
MVPGRYIQELAISIWIRNLAVTEVAWAMAVINDKAQDVDAKADMRKFPSRQGNKC